MTPDSSPTRQATTRTLLFFLVGVGLFILIFMHAGITLHDVKNSLVAIIPGMHLVIGLMYLIILLFAAKRFQAIIHFLVPASPYPRGFFLYTLSLSQVFSYLPLRQVGSVGAKAVCLSSEIGPCTKEGIYAGTVEVLINAVMVSSLGIFSLAAFMGKLPSASLLPSSLLFLLCICVAIICSFKTIIKLITMLSGHLRALLRRKEPDVQKKSATLLKYTLSRKILVLVVGASFVAYILSVLRCLLIAEAMGMQIDRTTFIVLYPAVMLISSLGITPAGLGITELGWIGLLTFTGAGTDQAALYAISKRIIDDVNLLLCLAGSYAGYSISRARNIRTRP